MGKYVGQLLLLLFCSFTSSFHLNVPPGSSSCSRPLRVTNQCRGVQPLRMMASSEGSQEPQMDERVVAESGSDDAATPYTPNILWWTTSKQEEDKTLNQTANAGILAVAALFAFAIIVGVDSDVSRGWTTGEFLFRIPVDNWRGYSEMLRISPVKVKACTSGIVYAVGDWVAQTVAGTKLSDIDRGRVLRSAMAGLLLHGPLSHLWYDICEGVFDKIEWNDYWWVAAPKMVTDQLLWGPVWNGIYISVTGALKRDSFETIKDAVISTAVPLVLAGIRLWPLAHLVTYGLIPTENRVLWVDAVEILWVTILSKQAAEKAAEQQGEAGR